MKPQGVVFSMIEMSSGSWAVWFGYFILFVKTPLRRVKFGARQLTSMAGLQGDDQTKVRTTRRWQRRKDDGLDARSFTFAKSAFLDALGDRSVVFSFLELMRNLRLSCSSHHMDATRSESLVCQCHRSWRKSKQLCKPHHMSEIKDTVLSTVLPIIENIAAVVLFTPQERDQGRKFEQRVMFPVPTSFPLGRHSTARSAGRCTSTGHKNKGYRLVEIRSTTRGEAWPRSPSEGKMADIRSST